MSQATDYDVANASGASVRADLNTILLAIATDNAGASAPSTTYANMRWVDTTNSRRKQRNNANSTWVDLGPMDNRYETRVPILSKSAGYTAAAADRGSLIDFTTAGVTLAYTAAATLGADWYVYVRNSAGSGVITHDPNSTEQIDGATTITQTINDGAWLVVCDGTGFKTSRVKDLVGDSGSGGTRGLVPAPAANDAAGGKILSADGTWKVHPGLRGYLAGLGLSRNGGTPNSKIDIAVGVCRDDTNAVDIVVGSTLTIDFGTTGANALDTGAKANSTWYHIYVIQKADGTKAGLGSTSLTPTMPSGYGYKRRLGSCRTDGSGNFLAFSQVGDEFLWLASILDVNANNPGTSAVSRTLTVPTGVKVWALINVHLRNVGSGVTPTLLISALDRNDETPANNAAPLGSTGISVYASGGSTDPGGGPYAMRTNTSAQVRSRIDASDGNVTVYVATLGWVDRRGRDD